MLAAAGAKATLYLHQWDKRALSRPEWEDFDGEWPDVMDGEGFLAAHSHLNPAVPVTTPELDAFCDFSEAWRQYVRGNRKPLLALQALAPGLRLDSLRAYEGLYGYLLPWARQLARHDVSCSAYFPIPAYLSGKPYCAFATGDDLQHDCGLASRLGQLLALAFNGARFLWISNPHVLGHCRRLGFKNGIYLPYPMDDRRYAPLGPAAGEPKARKEWEARFGPGFYVLSTARLDQSVKGNSGLFDDLALLTLRLPSVRFVFLSWGKDAQDMAQRIERAGLQKHFIMLAPVGKVRLIDYYRSCDCVLDQLIYGYYGATGLEALSVGKPVVMHIRTDHYEPLYGGDVAPVVNCADASAVVKALETLAQSPEHRARIGQASRAWLVRHHGEQATIPLMLALLQFTAEGAALPPEVRSPLWDEETPEEILYHKSRLRAASGGDSQ
jgi:glycosyltransferase involved in cell wall biosynthesis